MPNGQELEQSLVVAHSDSEDEAVDDLEFDRTTEADADEDADVDDDILDPMEGDAAAEDATEGDEVRLLLENLKSRLVILNLKPCTRNLLRMTRKMVQRTTMTSNLSNLL
jgi:hypothetical protein